MKTFAVILRKNPPKSNTFDVWVVLVEAEDGPAAVAKVLRRKLWARFLLEPGTFSVKVSPADA